MMISVMPTVFAQTNNTFYGIGALANISSGDYNVAIGDFALHFNTIGSYNTATGYRALYSNTGGYHNEALGYEALYSNTTGSYNIATGYLALYSNTTGDYNIALGREALNSNTTGVRNTANGYLTLRYNTTGSYNAATGFGALRANTTGRYNTAMGYNALPFNTTGEYNTALGYEAGGNGRAYSYSTAIGYNARITASNQVRLGYTNTTSIGGYHGWTNLSDGRFKNDIQENVKGLEFINELRPVSYYVDYKSLNKFLGDELEADEAATTAPSKITYQTGFIAQEVEATAKKLGFNQFHGVDAPKNENDHYGLRYSEFVVPLVKSVQELSAKCEQQEASIDALKTMLAQQQAQIEQLLQAQTTHTTTTKSLQGARLGQNTPNPFSVETQIQVEVPATAKHAFLQVSNLEGKQILIQAINERGASNVTLSAGKLPAGVYLYTLVVDDQFVDSKRMILTK